MHVHGREMEGFVGHLPKVDGTPVIKVRMMAKASST